MKTCIMLDSYVTHRHEKHRGNVWGYSQRNLPRRDTSAGLWVMWWEPELRSWRPGWDFPGPSERPPAPAWSSSGSGTPLAGTGCGTATPGSGTPGRRRCCCRRRGAARSPALSLKGTQTRQYRSRSYNNIHRQQSRCVSACSARVNGAIRGQCPMWMISIN